MTAPEFDIPQPVLDALDDILDIDPLEPGWRDQPPDALIATVARLDEALEVGDLDFAENKIRLRRKTVKGQRSVRARSVQVPGWLMDAIAATLPPLEDRDATARVFPGFTDDGARNAMARACVTAGIPHFSPYSLRHRRTSLWHGQGVPIRELMARTGHAKASTTLDVYSHVLVDATELTAAELLSRRGPGVVND